MNDLTQLLNDPTLCSQLQASGLLNYVGLALFPTVTWLVEYLKVQWPFTKRFAPVLSQILGVITNIGMGSVAGLPASQSVLLGVVTGLFSNIYYDMKKPSIKAAPTVVNVSN